jgi:hypothetical protein
MLPATTNEQVQREAAHDEAEATQVEQDVVRQLTVPASHAMTRQANLPLMRPQIVVQRLPMASAEAATNDVTPPGMVTYTIPQVERMEDETVMREETLSSATAPSASTSTTVEMQPQPPDLDELARQIYPLLKRMLWVERERTAGWTK